MEKFGKWLKTHETHVHHEKLGGVMGMYGDDVHDAIAKLVHRMIPIVKDALKGRSAVAAFDEMMEALPVAVSLAIPEIQNMPMIYGMADLQNMRRELMDLERKEKDRKEPRPPPKDLDLKPYNPAHDKEREDEYPA